jgi:hypothetical protein
LTKNVILPGELEAIFLDLTDKNTAQTAVKMLPNHRAVFEKFVRAKIVFSRVDNPTSFFISIYYRNFNVTCSPPKKHRASPV